MQPILLTLLAALAAFLVVGLVLRRILVRVGVRAMARQPDVISLRRVDQHPWNDAAAVSDLAAPLLAAGFIDAGAFACPELPRFALWLFAKPDEAASACVYEHAAVGVWMDVFTRYQDGTNVTYSTARPTGLEQQPGRPVVHLPGTGSAALYRRFIAERKSAPMVAVDAARLPKAFADAYAENIRWRKQRGLSAAEVARTASRKNA